MGEGWGRAPINEDTAECMHTGVIEDQTPRVQEKMRHGVLGQIFSDLPATEKRKRRGRLGLVEAWKESHIEASLWWNVQLRKVRDLPGRLAALGGCQNPDTYVTPKPQKFPMSRQLEDSETMEALNLEIKNPTLPNPYIPHLTFKIR